MISLSIVEEVGTCLSKEIHKIHFVCFHQICLQCFGYFCFCCRTNTLHDTLKDHIGYCNVSARIFFADDI